LRKEKQCGRTGHEKQPYGEADSKNKQGVAAPNVAVGVLCRLGYARPRTWSRFLRVVRSRVEEEDGNIGLHRSP